MKYFRTVVYSSSCLTTEKASALFLKAEETTLDGDLIPHPKGSGLNET